MPQRKKLVHIFPRGDKIAGIEQNAFWFWFQSDSLAFYRLVEMVAGKQQAMLATSDNKCPLCTLYFFAAVFMNGLHNLFWLEPRIIIVCVWKICQFPRKTETAANAGFRKKQMHPFNSYHIDRMSLYYFDRSDNGWNIARLLQPFMIKDLIIWCRLMLILDRLALLFIADNKKKFTTEWRKSYRRCERENERIVEENKENTMRVEQTKQTVPIKGA